MNHHFGIEIWRIQTASARADRRRVARRARRPARLSWSLGFAWRVTVVGLVLVMALFAGVAFARPLGPGTPGSGMSIDPGGLLIAGTAVLILMNRNRRTPKI
jgi:hypothetical protein